MKSRAANKKLKTKCEGWGPFGYLQRSRCLLLWESKKIWGLNSGFNRVLGFQRHIECTGDEGPLW